MTLETIQNFIKNIKNFFRSGASPTMAIVPIVVILVIMAISMLWGFFKGIWSTLIITCFSILIAVGTFALLSNVDFISWVQDEKAQKYKEEINAIIKGLILFSALFILQMIALVITELITHFSGLTVKKIKKKGKKVLVHKLTGLFVAPISVIPITISAVNLTGIIGYNNQTIKLNDYILDKLSGGKIKGFSKYLSIISAIVEFIPDFDTDANAIKESLDLKVDEKNDVKQEYNLIENKYEITIFKNGASDKQIEQSNKIISTANRIVNGITSSKESTQLIEKILSDFTPSKEETEFVVDAIKNFSNNIKEKGGNPKKTKIDLKFNSDKIQPLILNISQEQKDSIKNLILNRYFNSKENQEYKEIAQNFFDQLIKIKTEKAE